MLARKWDRIEFLVENKYQDDILLAIEAGEQHAGLDYKTIDYDRKESLLDDIKDLRNYLLLILMEEKKRLKEETTETQQRIMEEIESDSQRPSG